MLVELRKMVSKMTWPLPSRNCIQWTFAEQYPRKLSHWHAQSQVVISASHSKDHSIQIMKGHRSWLSIIRKAMKAYLPAPCVTTLIQLPILTARYIYIRPSASGLLEIRRFVQTVCLSEFIVVGSHYHKAIWDAVK